MTKLSNIYWLTLLEAQLAARRRHTANPIDVRKHVEIFNALRRACEDKAER